MKVYFLIPTRNRKELLSKCLDSIFNQTYPNIEVVVINDGSTDGTSELLKKSYKQVHEIEGNGNLWWTGAMIEGAKYVLDRVSVDDFILIQNDDTFMPKDFVATLVNQSISNNRIIIGTALREYETKEFISNSDRIVYGSFRPVLIDTKEELVYADTLSGRGVLIPCEVFKKIGNFSKLFPHYAADYDFFCRAKLNGFKLYVSTKAITYSTSTLPNLSKKVKAKNKLSLKDIYDLFFSRRSSNNLWGSTMITLLYSPFKYKLYGILRIYAYVLKLILVDCIYKNIKFVLTKK